MTLPLRIEPDAAEELREAVRWYEAEQAGLGARFYEVATATIESLRDRPDLGAPARRGPAGTRRLPLTRFPYSVAHIVHAGVLHVLAVVHGRRRPGYWHARRPG